MYVNEHRRLGLTLQRFPVLQDIYLYVSCRVFASRRAGHDRNGSPADCPYCGLSVLMKRHIGCSRTWLRSVVSRWRRSWSVPSIAFAARNSSTTRMLSGSQSSRIQRLEPKSKQRMRYGTARSLMDWMLRSGSRLLRRNLVGQSRSCCRARAGWPPSSPRHFNQYVQSRATWPRHRSHAYADTTRISLPCGTLANGERTE